MTKASALWILALGIWLLWGDEVVVEAREWKELVDPLLYRYPGVDAPRILLVQEHNPFDFGDEHSSSHNKLPTEAPSQAPIPSYGTPVPSTAVPTARYENVDGNGGCQAHQILYQVNMLDWWGDGWDNTKLTISKLAPQGEEPGTVVSEDGTDKTVISEVVKVNHPKGIGFKNFVTTTKPVFSGSLDSGYEGHDYVCLEENQCYKVHVGGGYWESDVKWTLRKVTLGVSRDDWDEPLTQGLAPTTCHFSLDGQTCPNNCGIRTDRPTPSPSQAAIPTAEIPTPSRPWPSPIYSPVYSPAYSPSVASPVASPAYTPVASPAYSPSVASWPGYTPSMNLGAWPAYMAWPGYTPNYWSEWSPAAAPDSNWAVQSQENTAPAPWAPAPWAPAPWAPAPWAPAPASW